MQLQSDSRGLTLYYGLIFCGLLAITNCSHQTPRAPSDGIDFFPAPGGAESGETQNLSLIEQGYGHYRRADFPRAIAQLEAAFLVDRQSQETWPKYVLFYCYLATGEYDKALSLAEDLAKAHPFRALSYQQVGLAHLWLGQPKAALDHFKRALEFDTHSPRVYFYQGLAFGQMQQTAERDKSFEKAEKEYRQILTLNPKDLSANYELASLLLYANRNVDQAGILLTTAKETLAVGFDEELAPDKRLYQRFYLPLLEGIFLSRKGEAKSSQKLLFEALANAPSGARADIAEVYHYAGVNGFSLGNEDEAKGFFAKSLELDPKGPYSNVAQISTRIPSNKSEPRRRHRR